MTLPASGAITMQQVANELRISQTGISLNHSWVRTLAGKLSGGISLNDLHGQTGSFNGAKASSGNQVPLNVPFFGSTLLDMETLTDGGGNPTNLTLNWSGLQGRWTGNVRVTNQSTGVSVVMGPNGTTGWISGYVANLIRVGASGDVFLIQPA